MSRVTKIVLGAAIAIILFVALLVFLVPGEMITRVVAVCSFAIALGKTAYDIFDKERERKKKADEGKERLQATARYGMWDSTAYELGVVLYNPGTTSIHIKTVVCHCKSDDGQQVATWSFSNLNHQHTELLPAKHTARFRSGPFNDAALQRIAAMKKENVWITVSSYQEEVCRVDGEHIVSVLNSPPTGF